MNSKELILLPLHPSQGRGTPNDQLPYPRDPQWSETKARPPWLKVRLQSTDKYREIQALTEGLHLNTVCQEARCPNIFECWSEGTATFMVMGDICTRACGFCAVKTGRPQALDPKEPEHVAQAVHRMKLEHAVITSVDRDDLQDLGSAHFAAVIQAVRKRTPSTKIEVLIPDFQGRADCLDRVLEAQPDVLNHNTETVPRLHRRVRTRARYRWTLGVLAAASAHRDQKRPHLLVKSGLMLGLGESLVEVQQTITDIREQGTDILTLGQYLRPSLKHLPVERYWRPEEFEDLRIFALDLGFKFVESGPLVRSSYHAGRHRRGAEAQG